MENVEAFEKGKLIKESLKIIDKLADSDLADMDGNFTIDDFDYELLQNLIVKARKIANNPYFKLT